MTSAEVCLGKLVILGLFLGGVLFKVLLIGGLCPFSSMMQSRKVI